MPLIVTLPEVVRDKTAFILLIAAKVIQRQRASMQFALTNPALYRLMFSADTDSVNDLHLHERALSALALLTEALAQGQSEGLLHTRDVRSQAAACWALMHGLALLNIDGLLLPEKVGPAPIENALMTLLEGLERPNLAL